MSRVLYNGYNDRKRRSPSISALENSALVGTVALVYAESDAIYEAKKAQAELRYSNAEEQDVRMASVSKSSVVLSTAISIGSKTPRIQVT